MKMGIPHNVTTNIKNKLAGLHPNVKIPKVRSALHRALSKEHAHINRSPHVPNMH